VASSATSFADADFDDHKEERGDGGGNEILL
jgi:hypothetical protein